MDGQIFIRNLIKCESDMKKQQQYHFGGGAWPVWPNRSYGPDPRPRTTLGASSNARFLSERDTEFGRNLEIQT
jgi:hypothetical protein